MPLLELVKDAQTTSHEHAAKALWHLGQNEENQSAIPKAGGIQPLVALLTIGTEKTQQYAAAALETLSYKHIENQDALLAADAIDPLVNLLGSETKETQEHAKGALLQLASERAGMIPVVKNLVRVLDDRNPTAQMKAAEALAVLTKRSLENRKAISAAKAVVPLSQLLGDGMKVQDNTPQERAATVLADLARLGENKLLLVDSAAALVAMLSSDSPIAKTSAAGALCQIASVARNKEKLVEVGIIPPLVSILQGDLQEAQKLAVGALWHLSMVDFNKGKMVEAGVIPALVTVLDSEADEAREHAVAVISTLTRSHGANKKTVAQAGGIKPLIQLLTDPSIKTQKHAACALWSLSDGKDGIYDKQMVEEGLVPPLIGMLLQNEPTTVGFAAACLSCCCADPTARKGIVEAGGVSPLLGLLHQPNTWLSDQAKTMLKLLNIPFTEPDRVSPRSIISPRTQRSGYSPPLSATKTLPIRTEGFIDLERENPKVGELKTGDVVYVIERREELPNTWRALVSSEPNGEPKGWVTSGKEGVDFLVTESQRDASKKGSIVRGMKYKFFPHQVASATVDCVHFS